MLKCPNSARSAIFIAKRPLFNSPSSVRSGIGLRFDMSLLTELEGFYKYCAPNGAGGATLIAGHRYRCRTAWPPSNPSPQTPGQAPSLATATITNLRGWRGRGVVQDSLTQGGGPCAPWSSPYLGGRTPLVPQLFRHYPAFKGRLALRPVATGAGTQRVSAILEVECEGNCQGTRGALSLSLSISTVVGFRRRST